MNEGNKPRSKVTGRKARKTPGAKAKSPETDYDRFVRELSTGTKKPSKVSASNVRVGGRNVMKYSWSPPAGSGFTKSQMRKIAQDFSDEMAKKHPDGDMNITAFYGLRQRYWRSAEKWTNFGENVVLPLETNESDGQAPDPEEGYPRFIIYADLKGSIVKS